jgi:uroporphyrinogen decarboxylase
MWFHPATAVRFAHLLEIPTDYLGQAMGNDIQQTWVNNNYGMEGIVHEKDGDYHIDFWGIKWVRQFFFNQIAVYPLETATRQEVLAYEFPYEQIDFLLELMEPVVAASEDTFIGCDVSPCAYEMYWRLRGMENVLIEMISDPEFTYIMLGRCIDFAIELSERACSRFPLDWLWTGDDVASQLSMIMSPTSWRTLIKPHLARIFAVGKKHNLWVAFHCCGALRPIIPDLIEIGMDVLNPVQGNCPGMDPLQLKAEFGDHLAFMGGLDTQDMLPNGSVVEVRRETDRLLAGMTSGGGGYILAASHTISPETPDDNIFAMYEQVGISKEEILDRAAVIRKQLTLSQTEDKEDAGCQLC